MRTSPFTLSTSTRALLLLWSTALSLAGCDRFKSKPADNYVYVTSKQAFLRDRIAAVSNRTGEVANGDQLKVLDHARHFIKVQTGKGEVGWIEERAVATPEVSTEFEKLREQHKADTAIASGVVRDQVYLHIQPGRDAEHFYLLNEGDKLQLLRRATLEKTGGQTTIAQARKKIPQATGTNAVLKAAAPADPVPPTMEDWWLVRDAKGDTGWMISRMLDVDAPDALTRYSEGQRFVGAYLLRTVHDDEAPTDLKDIPEYVTVLSPYKAGLPYDFNQVRVFIWSLQHHRYETAFRDRNIEGYLPVNLGLLKDPVGKTPLAQQELPGFNYRVLAATSRAVTPDPVTGAMNPGQTISKIFRLEGNQVHRLAPVVLASEDEAHPEPEEKKDKARRKR